MLGELIIYYLKKKESSCKLLNMSFLVLQIQLSLLQYMARDEALTSRSSKNTTFIVTMYGSWRGGSLPEALEITHKWNK